MVTAKGLTLWFLAEFYFLSVNEKRTDCASVSNKLNKSAHQKPSTVNPGTNLSTRSMITAFITSKNNPKVMRVAGSVKNTKMGFTSTLRSARTTATIKDVVKVSTPTPGNTSARTRTTIAVNNS